MASGSPVMVAVKKDAAFMDFHVSFYYYPSWFFWLFSKQSMVWTDSCAGL